MYDFSDLFFGICEKRKDEFFDSNSKIILLDGIKKISNNLKILFFFFCYKIHLKHIDI